MADMMEPVHGEREAAARSAARFEPELPLGPGPDPPRYLSCPDTGTSAAWPGSVWFWFCCVGAARPAGREDADSSLSRAPAAEMFL